MRTSRALYKVALVFLGLITATECHAGMPSIALRDIYKLRFQELSFFIFLLLVCSVLFKVMWNYAAKGFSWLPMLNFRRAFCLATLFGLLMLLILTMISGTREVLTPGAWRKQGSTYRLNDPAREPVRRRSLEHLRLALFEYARANGGNFPAHDFTPDIPEKIWESPDQEGSHYIYTGGLTTNHLDSLLAAEPPNFGEPRFVLLSSGEVQSLRNEQIEAKLNPRAVK